MITNDFVFIIDRLGVNGVIPIQFRSIQHYFALAGRVFFSLRTFFFGFLVKTFRDS